MSTHLLNTLIQVIDKDIVPLTQAGVKKGNKVFGSAILRKEDHSLVVAGTNNELENPLWHGEVHTLKLFYEMPHTERPDTKDCLFLTTHEPCSLCLSAITWAGFDNFYYLFKYEDTSQSFNIPHDLKILKEVFAIDNGQYVHENAFWKSHSLTDHIAQLPKDERTTLDLQVAQLEQKYAALSATYQATKNTTTIPLA